MPNSRRSSLRDRFVGGGLQTRLVGAVAALVVACGGFMAYRAIVAIEDAYRWTGEAEAATVARGFARSLSSRDLHDLARIRSRAERLGGVHPDLVGVAVEPAAPGPAGQPTYVRDDSRAVLTFPLIDGRGRAAATLRMRFAHDERAEAAAAGRREVLLAGAGAALLMIIGVGLIARRLVVEPLERLARAGMALAAGRPGPALGWRRRDAFGPLAGSLDALGGTVRALNARIDGLAL
jgi:HAMP domain-containing protein